MEKYLTHLLKETSHSNARLELARLLKDGMKDLLNLKKGKKPLLFAHPITPMDHRVTLQWSLPMQLLSLTLNF